MQATNRIDMVDALRGYALLGLFMVHCVERFELYWLSPMPDPWFDAVWALFAGKAFAIFALLFGFSFATIMANERARGGDFTWRFAWRLLLLLAIGTVHVLFYRGDVLQVLAVVGLLLIPFDRVRSDRLLLVLAALAFVQIPLWLRWWAAGQGAGWAMAAPLYNSWGDLQTLADGSMLAVAIDNLGPGTVGKWSYYLETGRVLEIAGLFLVGMVIHRRRLFADAAGKRGLWLAVAGVSAALWLVAVGVEGSLAPASEAQKQSAEWLIGQARNLPAMAFQVALFVLLWSTPVRALQALLVPAGKMTLTLYVGQSVVGAALFYGWGLGLWDRLSNAQAVLGGLVAFAAQLALAAWWFRRFRYGPLEWLWRVATRTSLAVPFRA
ncbi:MAG TPA: DUF418 domain-containing protein [Croceibacterium sp.]|nr:DUF418 domain-containing protein [Croceibacterium sp.]